MSTDFETAMTKVQTLASESAGNLATLRQGILNLAPTVGIGPTALADALLVIESTGFRGAQAMEILTASAKASAVGLGATEGVARALTAAINAYGAENLTAAQAADVLFATVDAGGAEATELAGELGRVVGLASQMGVSFQEVGAFIATYTRLGLSAAEATTGLSGVLNTLLSPSAEATKALAGMGTSIGELRASVAEKGLSAALIDLQGRFQGNTEAAAAVFGNVRALAGVMGTAGSQATTYRQVLEQISTSTNILNERFAIWRTTTAATWKEFTAQVQVAGIQLGERLAPAFSRVLQAAAPLLDHVVKLIAWFSQLPQGVQTFTIGAVALGAALGPVLFAIGNLMKVGSGLLGLLRLVGTTSTASAIGVRALGMAFSWPVAAIIAGIGGITLALKGLTLARQADARAGVVVGGEGLPVAMPELAPGITEDYKSQEQALYAHLSKIAIAKQKARELLKDPVIGTGGFVSPAAVAEVSAATAEISAFDKAVQALTEKLSGKDLVTGVNQWMTAIDRIGGIGALTHDELTQFQNDVVKAVEKMRLMGEVVPRTWAMIADSIRNNSILQATRDSLGDSLSMGLNKQQLLLQSSQLTPGLTTAPSAGANQNASAGVPPQVTEMSEGVRQIANVIENVQTAINGSFAQMLIGAKGFKDGFLDIWSSLKAGVMNIFNSILSSFVNSFLKGMLGALMGHKGAFQAAFSGMFGGGGGISSLLGLGSSAAGIGGAGASSGIGAGGAAAGIGGGIGMGTAIAATGGVAAAAVLAWAIYKKGLFRGGEESLKVNQPRDEYLAQFGGAGVGEGSGFQNLAAKLTELTGEGGGGRLFTALKEADTQQEFLAATEAINAKLATQTLAQQALTTTSTELTTGLETMDTSATELTTALAGLNAAVADPDGGATAAVYGLAAAIETASLALASLPAIGSRGSGPGAGMPDFDPGIVSAGPPPVTINAGTIIGNPDELAEMVTDAWEGGGDAYNRYRVLTEQMS